MTASSKTACLDVGCQKVRMQQMLEKGEEGVALGVGVGVRGIHVTNLIH